jgi:hypothetical protein
MGVPFGKLVLPTTTTTEIDHSVPSAQSIDHIGKITHLGDEWRARLNRNQSTFAALGRGGLGWGDGLGEAEGLGHAT